MKAVVRSRPRGTGSNKLIVPLFAVGANSFDEFQCFLRNSALCYSFLLTILVRLYESPSLCTISTTSQTIEPQTSHLIVLLPKSSVPNTIPNSHPIWHHIIHTTSHLFDHSIKQISTIPAPFSISSKHSFRNCISANMFLANLPFYVMKLRRQLFVLKDSKKARFEIRDASHKA